MTALDDLVAKKKPKQPERPKDYHASGFLVRFPEEYRERLARIQQLSGAPTITESARRAIDAYLKALEDSAK